jgi:hypothetical protein
MVQSAGDCGNAEEYARKKDAHPLKPFFSVKEKLKAKT